MSSSIRLGAEEALDADFDEPYWLSISVDGSPELDRIALASAPYSLHSATVPASGVGTIGGADGQVLTIIGGVARPGKIRQTVVAAVAVERVTLRQ